MFQFVRSRQTSTGSHPLGKAALLEGLRASELGIVESFVYDRHFLPGEVIFDKHEDAQALYIIVSGSVLICHPGLSSKPIATLGAGDFFGELALLDNSPRSAQARAGAETRLAVLFRGDFERLMESHAHIASRIAMQLARHLGQRLRSVVDLLPTEVIPR